MGIHAHHFPLINTGSGISAGSAVCYKQPEVTACRRIVKRNFRKVLAVIGDALDGGPIVVISQIILVLKLFRGGIFILEHLQ